MKGRLKQALWSVSPSLFRLLSKPAQGQTFSIGVYTGQSPLSLTSPDRTTNPVLTSQDVTDVPAEFVADPFMVRDGDRWYLFFEVMNSATRRGEIAVATSGDGYAWKYARSVLREPFHLAYPYAFRYKDTFYLVPDTPDQGARLYRAIDFPVRWEFVHTLVHGGRFSDSSIFEFDGDWWMLTAWSAGRSIRKSLRLFFADEPIGPWQEHPASPVLRANARRSRPGGRVVAVDGAPVRFAQDGFPEYGSSVRAFKITRLNRHAYAERELASSNPVLRADENGTGWNSGGMHHLDAHQLGTGNWIGYVDGWYT